MELVDIALAYAANNWFVFPCGYKSKAPIIKGGLTNASRDPDVIRAWWELHPNANIAIRTGEGLVVVDVDMSEVPSFIDLPDTLRVKTGKGYHFYYYTEGKVKNGVNVYHDGVKVSGLDIRGDGGYVIAPGSTHPNGSIYYWESSPHDPLGPFHAGPTDVLEPISLTEKPAWLDEASKPVVEERTMRPVEATSENAAWAPAGKGGRDHGAVRLGSFLVKQGLTNQRSIANSILGWNDRSDQPMGTLVDDPDDVDAWAMTKAMSALKLATGNGGRKLSPVTTTDLLELAINREWIVEGGILTERSKTILYGAPGTGKTYLAMQLASCIASGIPFLGYYHIPRPRKVLYLSGENKLDDIKGRIIAADQEYPFNRDVLWEATFDLNLRSKEGQQVLAECVKEYKIEVLFIDPLYIFARVDESKLLEVIDVEVALDTLIEANNLSCVLVHHPTKDQTNYKGETVDRGLNELRGAGWGMWAEGVIKLSEMVPGTLHGDRKIVFQKTRSGPPAQPVILTFSENQVFQVKDLGGDDAIIQWVKERERCFMVDIRKALASTPGCANISRSIKRLVESKRLKWNGHQKGYITIGSER